MKVLLTASVQSHICQFHRPLVEMLHENGCEVHVAACDNLAEKNGLKLDFAEKVYNVPFARSPRSKNNIKAYKELKKIIDNGHFDVIHCNTPMAGIVTRLAARNVRKAGTKVYYTAHGFHFYADSPRKNWLVFYPVEKLFSRMTDKLITITEEDYKLASQKFHCKVKRIHGVGCNTKKIYVMSDEEKLRVRKDLGISENTKVILNIGELLPNKNQEAIIGAMEAIVKKFPDSQLLVAGNGQAKDKLKKLIEEKHLESHVTMLGYTTQINHYLNICDVLVACSYREGLPLNLMEAMVCGKPIVASNNRGHRELVNNGMNGYLVEADNVGGFAKRICKILQENKDYSQIASQMVKPFTDTNVKKELEEVYDIQTS